MREGPELKKRMKERGMKAAAARQERKVVERIHVEGLREMIWRDKDADYLSGWRWYARRAFDREVVIPQGRKDGFYQGMHDSKKFAAAFHNGTAPIVIEGMKPGEVTEVIRKETGNEVADFLAKSGMKQKDLAELMGIKPSMVSFIVTGRSRIPKARLERFRQIVKEWEEENGEKILHDM